MQTTERNGEMVAATAGGAEHELMLISSNGTLVRTPVGEISVVGRNTQGVRLIRLDEGERLTGVERVEPETGDVEDRRQRPCRASPTAGSLRARRRPDIFRALRVNNGRSGCYTAVQKVRLESRSMRVFNFTAGPATLPLEVLEQLQRRDARLARAAACR